MKKTIYFIIFFVFLFPRISKANDSYEYMSAVVQSLSTLEIATDRESNNEPNSLILMMKNLISFNYELIKANSMIKPYHSSTDVYIKKSSEAISRIYSFLKITNQKLVEYIEELLNNPEKYVSKEGTIAKTIGNISAENDKIWRMLPEAIALSTYCLVDFNNSERKNGKYLMITSVEKEKLLNQLISGFGEEIKEGPKGGQFALRVSAGSLYKFLNQPWKTINYN